MDLFRLDGKVAIVTGGYGLYGSQISTALSEAGAHVIIAARDEKKCGEFAGVLCGRGFKAEGMKVDLSDENSINGFVSKVIQKHGRIDVLVNNSVSRNGFSNIEEATREGWEASSKVNSTGLMLITKATVKNMREQRSGSIINISSIQGVVGPNFAVYGSTGMTSPTNYTYDKWGMVGFTKWLANYYGKYNVRANCISPGGYLGRKISEYDTEFLENYKRLTPLGRFADEDDLKGAVVFLASEASAYVTGHNLLVDGGWTSW